MSAHGAPDLFPDLIFSEILIRCPAKSICRFKCVSKRWCSLISNPRFIASYASRSAPSWVAVDRVVRVEKGPKEFVLSLREPPDVSSLSVSPHLVEQDLVDFSSNQFPTAISGSGGFLLFSVARKRDPYSEKEKRPDFFSHERSYGTLALCNPITHQLIELPNSPNLISSRAAIGFAPRAAGPGGSVLDFVVVEYAPIIGSAAASLMIFSSETGKWEIKSANYMLGMHFWNPGGVFEFDGHLVWVDKSCGFIVWDEPFSREEVAQLRFIRLPQGCSRRFDTPNLSDERCAGAGDGCILYMELVENGKFLRLWQWKDYNNGGWALVHKSSLKDIWFDDICFGRRLPKMTPQLLFNHPFDVNVAFFNVGDVIYSVNVVDKKVLGRAIPSRLTKDIWTFPFLLPSWPASFSPVLLASVAKERGNKHFNDKSWNEAVTCYSQSIKHAPTAVAYANRAAAHLKLSEYKLTEADCTEALKLDDKYLKAYARRAIARKELGKLKEAEEDAKLCLKLNPKQSDIASLHAEITSSLEKAALKG
ncbi:unnamed protein product [Cuscuta campestris]|uniref:F-box domain-containing protein n=1 Tax=Cuscuta campestris TaxID=132261 RepID=A0A484MVN4_9ASTE|nr:unnamed protein product [Cuscuta campestris]